MALRNHINVSQRPFFAAPRLSAVKDRAAFFWRNGPARFRNSQRLRLFDHCHMGLIASNGTSLRAGAVIIPAFINVFLPPRPCISGKNIRQLASLYFTYPPPGIPGTVTGYISAFCAIVGRQFGIKGIWLLIVIEVRSLPSFHRRLGTHLHRSLLRILGCDAIAEYKNCQDQENSCDQPLLHN